MSKTSQYEAARMAAIGITEEDLYETRFPPSELTEPSVLKHAIRSPPPTSPCKTFSFGVGVKMDHGRRPAAIYRIRAKSADREEAMALGRRLVEWLDVQANDPEGARVGRHVELPFGSDKSARVYVTKAGRAAGWLT